MVPVCEGFHVIDFGEIDMTRKLIPAVVYAATAFAFAGFIDGLYGGEPITHHLGLIHVATAGAILFAVACVLSLFTPRVGVVCALVGGVLSWPYFAIQVFAIPWGSIVSILPYANWQDLLTAILALVVSSVYSVNQLRLLFRGRNDTEGRKMGFRLIAALVYAVGIVIVENWRGISDWLFRLRYGS
ncbi:MAG: hypothetical protein WCC59_13900 [Terriglobales bacterium]